MQKSKKTDNLSTAADVLQDILDHQKDCPKVVQYIMDYRSLCKSREVLDQGDETGGPSLKTLLRTAPPFAISSRSNSGGMLLQVSTCFRQTQGDNGRLSTERPNMQVSCTLFCFVSHPVTMLAHSELGNISVNFCREI